MCAPPGSSLPALQPPFSPAQRSEQATADLALGKASWRENMSWPVRPFEVLSRQEVFPS